MIPQKINFQTKPSAIPEPIIQPQPSPETPLQPPAQETAAPPEPKAPAFQDQILSEADFFAQYEHDTKIAADAIVNEETGEIRIDPSLSVSEASRPALTPDQAYKNTEMLINMRDGVQSFGLSYYVDGNVQEYERYRYPEPQKKQLIEAWVPIVQQSNLHVSPWIGVIVAEAMCTGPLLALAYKSRQQRIELEEARQTIKKQEAKIRKMEQQEVFDKPVRSPDSQKKWAVDNEGYFTHSPSGVYLKAGTRDEKPNLERDYDLLVKHNGRDFIHKIFKI